MTQEVKILPVLKILKEAYFALNQKQNKQHLFWAGSFIFCAVFNLLPKGFANPLSLVWAVGFYVFWCVFFRFYYQKKPYFSWQKIFASAVPSSKMIFITCALTMFMILVPFLPLMMGFKGKYLVFFEGYMSALQSPQTSLLNVMIFSTFFLMLSPIAFCRPYLAWISALQGYSGSVRKIFKKTQGNYFSFLGLVVLLDIPCIFAHEADIFLHCHGFFLVGFYSIYLIYLNIVFAKVYDFFNA